MSKLAVTEVDKLIGKRIQQRRKELGLTASALSEQIGLTQQQLSRYERGDNKINVAHLVEIASALNTSIGWFFLDCSSDTKQPQKFIPVSEDEIRDRIIYRLDSLNANERRGLLVFLDSLSAN